MTDTTNQAGADGFRIPRVGTPEADAFVAQLEARVQAVEARLEHDFVGVDEAENFCLKTGLNALTSQIRKENGSDLFFTKKPEAKKAKKKKKARVAI